MRWKGLEDRKEGLAVFLACHGVFADLSFKAASKLSDR